MGNHPKTNVAPSPDDLTRVGRYVIIDRIGVGGMGIVYRAYDPKLDRKVAVKLLKPGHKNGKQRLEREALAMARVSHQNVVPVHDVGSVDDRLFIAMEFIDGLSLADWLRLQPRSSQEVVTMFRGAAAGLAAAHEAGVVHRDFKPDNVMVDRKGRPQVTDFGVAAGDLARTVDLDESHCIDGSGDGLEVTRLTRLGAAVGTPAYMAPEQFQGESVDARSDQFSFCVALWEALWGERPFEGATVVDLSWAVTNGKIKIPTTPTPTWLYQVLVRGLSTDPSKRWPSMTTLLAELEFGHARSRQRWISYTILGSLIVASAGAGGLRYDRARRVSECKAAGAEIFQYWNDEKAQLAHDAFVTASEPALGNVAFEKVKVWIDAYSSTWAVRREETCLAANVDKTLQQNTYEMTRTCLEDRLVEFGEFSSVLQRGDRNIVNIAVFAAANLPTIEACVDYSRLRQDPPGETALSIRRLIAKATALELARDYLGARTAISEADSLAVQADMVAFLPRINVVKGIIAERTGEYDNAKRYFLAAFNDAAKGGADEVAAQAAQWLTFVIGYRLAQHAVGLAWGNFAEVWLERISIGERDVRLGNIYNHMGVIHDVSGNLELALIFHSRALAHRLASLGEAHPNVATSLNNIGVVYRGLGSVDDAADYYGRALDIQERVLGATHPEVAGTLNNLGNLYFEAKDFAAALAYYERALATFEGVLGGQHDTVAMSLNNIASALIEQKRYDLAYPAALRSLAIREKALGRAHPKTAKVLVTLGIARGKTGNLHEGIEMLEQSLISLEKALDRKHADLVKPLRSLGDLYADAGLFGESLSAYSRSLDIAEEVWGADDPRLINGIVGVCKACLKGNPAVRCLEPIGRLLELLETTERSPFENAEDLFELARVASNSSEGFVLAIDLATRAKGFLAENIALDEATADSLFHRIEQWMASNGWY